MIGELVVGKQVLERTRSAAEAERIDREHGVLWSDVVALVARRFELARERFAENHPQGVTRRRAVTSSQHELVAVRMLRPPVVVVQSALRTSGEVRSHVERRVRERSAEVSG